MEPPQSLLVVRLSAMGDIVLALQVTQEVARQWPACRITWVCNAAFAPMVRAMPFVHEVIPFQKKEKLRGLFRLIRELRKRRFDLAWDLHGLLRPSLITLLSGARKKWGIRSDKGLRGLTYSRCIPRLPGEAGRHLQAYAQAFPRAAGLDDTVRQLLQMRPAPAFPWESFFHGDPCRRFTLVTDSSQPAKNWTRFDALTEKILQEIPDSRVAWCAGKPVPPPRDFPAGRFLNLTGCPMDEMLALLRQPAVFVGNDTGPMHLSTALGNRVLALFGPTRPEDSGPRPLHPERVKVVEAPGGDLPALETHTVLEALRELIARR